ncbi:MAG: hypothetical protein SVU32_01115 [Candidatus Nanohaloarchaea archaeon]|nr:hypothetical protein [Candidatus Nanohaloarchaea archaeon]
MVEFDTLKSKEIEFGDGEFIQLARKRALSDEGDEVFISLSRGYIDADGDRRFKSSFSIPLDEDVVGFLVDNMSDMLED